jgi:hypothetical protein
MLEAQAALVVVAADMMEIIQNLAAQEIHHRFLRLKEIMAGQML